MYGVRCRGSSKGEGNAFFNLASGVSVVRSDRAFIVESHNETVRHESNKNSDIVDE